MKYSLKDLLTMGAAIIVVSSAMGLTFLVSPWVIGWAGLMAPAALFLLFLLIVGCLVGAHLRVTTRLVRLEPGEYDMDSMEFFFWKQRAVLWHLAEAWVMPLFPLFLKAAFFRLMGFKMGKDVVLAGGMMGEDAGLVTLGDRVIIGKNANLVGHILVRDSLRLGNVKVGNGVTIGVNAVIMPDTLIGEGSIVAANAVLAPGTRIPAGELWGGLPAKRIKALNNPLAAEA